MKCRVLLLVAASAFAYANPALAQDAAAQSAESDSNSGEIIVTAQRRAERLQDVPVTVTAVTDASLKSRGIESVSQLAQAAPSLQVSGGDNNYTVRGVGTLAFQQSLESSVATAQDEVNLVNPILGSAVGAFYDVARVEVLSGPQGLLFGKNASAGLINIVTRQPDIGVWGGDVQVESLIRPTTPTDSVGVTARGTINVPVSGNSALRINALYSHQDPVTQFVGSGTGNFGLTQYGVRAKYLVNFTDALSLYVIGDYNEEHGIATFFDRPYRSILPASNLTPFNAALGIVPGPDNLTIGGDGRFNRDTKRGGVQAKVAYVLPSGIEISNIAAWKAAKRFQENDTDYTNGYGANQVSGVKYSQFTNELRVALPATNRLTGQVGLFYYQGNTKFDSQLAGNQFRTPASIARAPFCVGITVGVTPGCTRNNSFFLGQDRKYDFDSKSYAAFSQFTYEVVDNLKLIAGARVTHDRIAIDLAQHQGFYFQTLGIPFLIKAEDTNTNFSYKLGAQYNFSRDVMVYGTYARGYKGPGFADNVVDDIPGTVVGNPVSPVVNPEINNNIEIGLKSSWFDRRLTFNVSAFRSKFTNQQVSSFDPSLGSAVIQNAASTTSKGIELSISARPLEGLSLDAAATILDSKFGDFPGAQCYPGQTSPGCAATGRFNAGGLTTPSSSKFAGSIQAEYAFGIDDGVEAYVQGNMTHRSRYNNVLNQAPGTWIEGHEIYGASIGLRSDAGWRLSAFCRNCGDKRVPTDIGVVSSENNQGRLGLQHVFGFKSFREIGMSFGFEF